ncbi:MAG: LysR family transcriptional regulator [Clostridia bacterium]
MQLEHLALFLKIAQEKSISKVAAASHISQPALSLQMQKVEDSLGCKLFERSNRGIELTEAGLLTQKYIAQMMDIYHTFEEEIQNLRNNRNVCRIASSRVVSNYALPCTLVKLKEHYPNYRFSLFSMPSKDVIRQVLTDQADIGFIVGATDEAGLHCKKVFSDRTVLVASMAYPYKDSITIAALKKQPLVLLDENYSSYHLLQEQLRQLGQDIETFNVQYHLDSTEAIKAMIESGMGIGLLPYMCVKKEIYLRQLRIIELSDLDLYYDVSSIYRQQPDNTGYELTELKQYIERVAAASIC